MSTELSKNVWNRKGGNINLRITWKVFRQAIAYNHPSSNSPAKGRRFSSLIAAKGLFAGRNDCFSQATLQNGVIYVCGRNIL